MTKSNTTQHQVIVRQFMWKYELLQRSAFITWLLYYLVLSDLELTHHRRPRDPAQQLGPAPDRQPGLRMCVRRRLPETAQSAREASTPGTGPGPEPEPPGQAPAPNPRDRPRPWPRTRHRGYTVPERGPGRGLRETVSPAVGQAMAPLWFLLPIPLLLPLLWLLSSGFRYYCKMGFYYSWIMALAVPVIPLCLFRGRDVENMKCTFTTQTAVDQENQTSISPENHQRSLDLMGMMEILPDRCVAIAKKELMYAGTVGLVCWLAGIIFINRQKKTDAKSVMTEAAQTMLKENIRLWVFPEGTRNHDGNMLPFKRGAFHLAIQAQVPIIPVVFSSYNDFYNRAEKRFTSGKCIVQILPPMETRGMTTDNVPDLTERARNLLMTTWNEISAPILKMHGAQ
ncbi:1-acyl-sn-glycerol-3-phosphate acyltransferase beta [Chiloscyllium plagiosum]|uniref:1-acyl-sn-glycerol-3-phosphate acyltransferase beta n=1 Tax=Chiloscyllium plagiosum TaxID=36176 RepID=UPI001CB80F2A|nr:1-acyl-sn-glycerol-3-phosphate acyltransferase beta [Chiloscyllium plagiosum]